MPKQLRAVLNSQSMTLSLERGVSLLFSVCPKIDQAGMPRKLKSIPQRCRRGGRQKGESEDTLPSGGLLEHCCKATEHIWKSHVSNPTSPGLKPPWPCAYARRTQLHAEAVAHTEDPMETPAALQNGVAVGAHWRVCFLRRQNLGSIGFYPEWNTSPRSQMQLLAPAHNGC